MSFRFTLALAFTGLSLASCASLPPPVPVIARSETATWDSSASRSSQLAIWSGGYQIGSGMVSQGFVAAATESGGLTLRDFQGAVLQQLPGRRLTDIDVAALPLDEGFTVMVGGTVRALSRTRIAIFRLNSNGVQAAQPWTEVTTDLSDPRGFCMRQTADGVQAVAFDRRGEARQFTISEGPDGAVVARETRRFRIPQAGRGCGIAAVSGHLYVSHARRGFWRYPLDATSSLAPTHMAAEGPAALPRSESVAIFSARGFTYLASLHPDGTAVSLWRVDRTDLMWVGRIEVRDPSDGRRVRKLTGVDIHGYELEGFPDGLMVVRGQAGARTSDLRYVDWSLVLRALGVEPAPIIAQ